ncbi:MAG: OsmC family protein [Flavobacteriaceae bacterium]
MNYSIRAESEAANDAIIHVKHSHIRFGTTDKTSETLPNPAELFLGSFAACILKNVERFSGMMRFGYEKAELTVKAERLENPPRMDRLTYELTIFTQDEKLNSALLKKNIEKFGTIYNTVKQICEISGNIVVRKNV